MKKSCLTFFVFLIALFLACGSIADKNKDYNTIITKEQTVSAETSVALNNGKVLEGSSQSTEEDKEELKEQLRLLGYLS